MTQPVTLPLWLFVLILLFAVVTFASHFLFPSVRWFFRKRAERLIARLNTRLARPIEPFKLAERHDMIQRLIYDPQVSEAVIAHAQKHDIPENVAFEKARDYAREIVPSFSATAYFTFGMRAARWLARSLYRVRVGAFDPHLVEEIGPDDAVIFVMNHRSNMDYVLVTYLVSRASALSYAVGEWARIWPLSAIIRSMGAYFIRRKNRSALYRRVLARYVQLAVRGSVTQAIFPEGGLSLNGKVGPPKMGLLSYIIEEFDPTGHDVVFVPVGVNYDRVLEDKVLIAAGQAGERKFRPPLGRLLRGVGGHLWQRVTGRFKGFGTASVGFGAPLSLQEFAKANDGADVEQVAEEIMRRVERVVPVLPVPLVADVMRDGRARSLSQIASGVAERIEQMEQAGVRRPGRDATKIASDAVTNLQARGLLTQANGVICAAPSAEDTLTYYASSIAHFLAEDGGQIPTVAAPAAAEEESVET